MGEAPSSSGAPQVSVREVALRARSVGVDGGPGRSLGSGAGVVRAAAGLSGATTCRKLLTEVVPVSEVAEQV